MKCFAVGTMLNFYSMYNAYANNPQQIGKLVELNLKAIGLAILEKFAEQ